MGVGVTEGGSGAYVSTSNQFLIYTGPPEAFRMNRAGLELFKAGSYPDAVKKFQATLAQYPGHPDAVYYLGLSLIGKDERSKGFELLTNFQDKNNYRVASEVRWWATYLQKKPELSAKEIFPTMRRIRAEAYNRYLNEKRRDPFDPF